MSLLNLNSLGDTEVSNEWGLSHVNDVKNAIEKEARNASVTMTVDKKTREELNREHDGELAKKTEEQERKRENRNQAVRDAAEGLVDAAKATGRGIKEVARIVYNLALGEDKQKSSDHPSKSKTDVNE